MTLSKNRRGRWALVLAIGISVPALAVVHGGSASGATASGAKEVNINHFAFHPPTLRIGAGGKVAFTNSSGITHTATSSGFNTGRIKAGTTVVVRFRHKGTFLYHCEIHPFMKGKVVVE